MANSRLLAHLGNFHASKGMNYEQHCDHVVEQAGRLRKLLADILTKLLA